MKRIEITVTRTIPATPSQVFDVWLDPTSPGSPWFGVERAIVNAVVDGLFYHCVRHEERDWPHYGRFVRLEKSRVIVHTWVSEATHGIESTVTITLDANGNETLVTLRHSDVPDDELGRRHEKGWGFILDAIVNRFASRER